MMKIKIDFFAQHVKINSLATLLLLLSFSVCFSSSINHSKQQYNGWYGGGDGSKDTNNQNSNKKRLLQQQQNLYEILKMVIVRKESYNLTSIGNQFGTHCNI